VSQNIGPFPSAESAQAALALVAGYVLRANVSNTNVWLVCPDEQTTDEALRASTAKPGQAHSIEQTPERFPIIGAGEFLKRPPMRWIIPGVLPQAELAVIYGESGSGKSFLAYDMLTAISQGIKWRGLPTLQGNVLYIAAEGVNGMRNRVQAYCDTNFVDPAALPDIIAASPNMLDPKESALLAKRVSECGKQYSVIAIDTWSAVTPGSNESSSEDSGKFISHAKLLHEQAGALVLVIDHSGKDASKGVRGWSGKKGAADAQIEVTRNVKTDERRWRVAKQKDGEDGAEHAFSLRTVPLGTDEDNNARASCVVVHDLAEVTRKRGQATGANEIKAEAIAREHGRIRIDDLEALTAKAMPAPEKGKRDERLKGAKRAVGNLLRKKILRLTRHQAGDVPGCKYVSPALLTTEEGF
jgi:hypothetical protein